MKIPIKPVVTFAICFVISAFVVFVFGKTLIKIIDGLSPIFQTSVTVLGALSLAFFTYSDNVEQKLSELYKRHSDDKIDKAHRSIASLKKELLTNAFCMVFLLILERIIANIPDGKYVLVIKQFQIDHHSILTALRSAIYIFGSLVFFDQGKAFITAIQFRHIVSRGAGTK